MAKLCVGAAANVQAEDVSQADWLRQFHLVFRTGSLPLQSPQKQHVEHFRRGSDLGTSTCFMCGKDDDETLEHFMNECMAYQPIKDASMWWRPLKVKDIVGAPGAHSPHVRLLFDMWGPRSGGSLSRRRRSEELYHSSDPHTLFIV